VKKIEGGICQDLNCVAGTVVLPTVESPWQALWPMFIAVDTILADKKPDLVVVEKTSSFSGGFVTGQVSNCMGVILACCGKHELPVLFVYPSHVKKVMTGKGRATKGQMKKSVKNVLSEFGCETKFDSEHACDATANILALLKEKAL